MSQIFQRVYSILQHPVVVFLAISSSQLIDNMNVVIFISSVNEIQQRFDTTYSIASWTLSAYSVTFSGFIMFFGRVGDIVGPRMVYISGLISLGICSIIAAAVDNLYVLIVFRALQGISAAATVPTSYAILVNTFSGKALNNAISGVTGLLIVALGIGAVISGAFQTVSIGYKGSLYVIAGFSLVTAFFSFIATKPKKISKTSVGSVKNLDFAGALFFISGAVLLVTGFTEAGQKWDSPRAYVPIVVGVLLIAAFFLWEVVILSGTRGENVDLMIPKPMWSVKNFKILPITSFLVYGAFFSEFLLGITFLIVCSGDSALIGGIKYAIPQNGFALLATVIPVIIGSRLSAKTYCIGALAVGLGGAVLIGRTSSGLTDYWKFEFPGVALIAGGVIIYFINYLNLIIFATPLEMQGLISGICLTMGQFGTAIAFSVITSILGDSVQTGNSDSEIAIRVYRKGFYVPLAFLAVSFILVFFFVRNLKPEDYAHSGNATQSEETPENDEDEKSSCSVSPDHLSIV